MKTTRYFEEEVLGRKRPYMKREWCMKAITAPDHSPSTGWQNALL